MKTSGDVEVTPMPVFVIAPAHVKQSGRVAHHSFLGDNLELFAAP
jgi:hypothetical protein